MNPIVELTKWDEATSKKRQSICANIASLFKDVTFRHLKRFSLEANSHEIGVFDHAGSSFLLIPGATFTLGFDSKTNAFPSEKLREAWRTEYQEPHGFQSLDEELQDVFSPQKQITLNPYLIEAEPRLPEIEGTDCPFHEDVESSLRGTPWRLPSRDEWEYAYRGGSASVFPWGDDPVLTSLLTIRSNAFGFTFPESLYHYEFVGDPTIMVGGDGGVTHCGGWGRLAESIVEACAYVDKNEAEPYRAHYRRCRSVYIKT